jgi:hypothetical protein
MVIVEDACNHFDNFTLRTVSTWSKKEDSPEGMFHQYSQISTN